ncbi:hypothetical protein [Methylomonas fluvii]|uniref:Uncharacterized protein n=1 Tax=Methylomonas fluvii TaxID=1854564 RepID=A0ABR9D9Z4_9GAMM|nr:hypothetical protein [Methylomonas fluvii]MBD9359646.1 hypothetical protein [Methylomonas fluvii]
MQIGYPADLSARQPRYFLLFGQKKVSKEKATPMPLISCAPEGEKTIPELKVAWSANQVAWM